MLPVIRPDRSSGMFFPCLQAARQNSASTSSLVSDSQCLYFNHSAADTNCAGTGAARRFEVEDLARIGEELLREIRCAAH
jgi:hypothetical protein